MTLCERRQLQVRPALNGLVRRAVFAFRAAARSVSSYRGVVPQPHWVDLKRIMGWAIFFVIPCVSARGSWARPLGGDKRATSAEWLLLAVLSGAILVLIIVSVIFALRRRKGCRPKQRRARGPGPLTRG